MCDDAFMDVRYAASTQRFFLPRLFSCAPRGMGERKFDSHYDVSCPGERARWALDPFRAP